MYHNIVPKYSAWIHLLSYIASWLTFKQAFDTLVHLLPESTFSIRYFCSSTIGMGDFHFYQIN